MTQKVTIKEKIYNGIFNDITEGIYSPNDILTESKLIEKYNVSKSPIREALIELCKDNILNSLPRLGYQVVPVSMKEVLDIIEFRLDLEISALKRSFPNIDDDSIEELTKADKSSNSGKDQGVVANWMSNQLFHLELCKLCGNEYTYKTLQEVLKQSSRYVAQYFNSAWDKSNESNGKYHLEIINTLKERDYESAIHMLAKDIMAVKEQIKQTYSF